VSGRVANRPGKLHGRLGLAGVEPLLEVAADRLAAREDGLVPDAARRELHDADVLVALAVTASVRRGLVEGPKAVALPLSPHYAGDLPEPPAKRNPLEPRVVQFATKTVRSHSLRAGDDATD
jgi:hypothetical protein